MKYHLIYGAVLSTSGPYVYIDKSHNPCGCYYDARLVLDLPHIRTLKRMFHAYYKNDYKTQIKPEKNI